MACCMLLALIVGNIVLMWRRLRSWWSPAAMVEVAADTGAAAWRPGIEFTSSTLSARETRRTRLLKPVGIVLVTVSLGYFAVQAKAAIEGASDARTFALLLAQNICRVPPAAKAPSQIAALPTRAESTRR